MGEQPLIYISILCWSHVIVFSSESFFCVLFERHIQASARFAPRPRSRILLRKSKAVLARGSGSKRGLYWNVDIYFRYFPLRSTWSKDFSNRIRAVADDFPPMSNPSSRKSFSPQFWIISFCPYTYLHFLQCHLSFLHDICETVFEFKNCIT